MAEIEKLVEDKIKDNKVMIFAKSYCPHCKKAKEVFKSMGQVFEAMELDQEKDGEAVHDYIKKKTKSNTVPQVFVGGELIGGGSETVKARDDGTLQTLLDKQ